MYDTQQTLPLAFLSQLHYSTFTDLSWSPDGMSLFMTSTDGFGSLAVFEPGELGEPFEENISESVDVEIPQETCEQNTCEIIDQIDVKENILVETTPKVHLLDQGIIKKRRIEPTFICK